MSVRLEKTRDPPEHVDGPNLESGPWRRDLWS